MNHPEILLLPVFMFAVYFLTVLGARMREQIYARHFRLEHYELNPIWQKQIAQKRWFNPRHIVLTLFVSAFLIWSVETGRLYEDALPGLLGMMLIPLCLDPRTAWSELAYISPSQPVAGRGVR